MLARLAPPLLLAVAVACGAARTPHEPGPGDPAPSDPAALTARAAEALAAGDLEAADDAARAAVEAGGALDARIVSARVALAYGDHPRVLSLLADATDPIGARLRARALMRTGDLVEAARALEAVDGMEPADGWAAVALPIARRGAARDAYRIEGPERAELPMDPRTPVPVATLTLDGEEVAALFATSADLTVVAHDRLEEPGLAGAIGLGDIVVHDVPAIPRDLAPVSEALGVDVGVVVGADLMLRLRATLDGRERRIVLRRRGSEASPDARSVPFVTFDGSFVAVRGELVRPGGASTSGWLTVDSSGGFPLAVADAAVAALGLSPADLEAVDGAPAGVRTFALSRVRLGSIEIEGLPAATGLLSPELSEVAGAAIAGTLGAQVLAQMKVGFDPARRLMMVE